MGDVIIRFWVYVGITLVVLVLRWLRWYYVGCYTLA